MRQTKTVSRSFAMLLLSLSMSGCITLSASRSRNEPAQDPIAWGMLTNASGCVIFGEHRKAQVGFFLVAVAAKTYGELEVLESTGYELPKKLWSQDQAGMDELQALAQSEGLRGEIQTPAQLQERIRLDLYYIAHWSVWLDVQITLRTLKQVFVPPKSAY